MSEGNTLFCYREYGRGGNRFRLGSQKKRSIQGEENEKKSHQRLEEGGWEIIKTVSGIRKEGREAETRQIIQKQSINHNHIFLKNQDIGGKH